MKREPFGNVHRERNQTQLEGLREEDEFLLFKAVTPRKGSAQERTESVSFRVENRSLVAVRGFFRRDSFCVVCGFRG